MLTKIRTSPDDIYYNISMTNNNTGSFNFAVPAVYTANKTVPILNKADDYYCSVCQFSIPLDTVPLTICPVLPTIGNINTTPMIIGIRDFTNNVYYPQNLIWTPELNEVPPVVQVGSLAQIVSSYHFMYNIVTMINMYNTALALAVTAYNLGSGNNLSIPIFVFNPVTSLVSLIAKLSDWNTTNPQSVGIYVNTVGYNFLDSIPVQSYKSNQIGGTIDLVFKIYYDGLNGYPSNIAYPANPTYISMSMNYPTMYLWASLRKIIITSSSLPLNYEQTPTINNLNPDNYNSINIVADFIPQNDITGATRQIAFYSTSGQYRLIDLLSSSYLNKIQLEIFWQDVNQNLYPLYISQNQEATLKLIFTRKELYLNQ
jgi:hypothetical protein